MINALKDKIIVEFLKTAKTESGLIIPDSAKDPQGFGRVLSVGEEVRNIKEGDVLVFHMMAGMDLILNKTVQKCLKAEEVYGILDDEDLVSRLEPLVFEAKPEKKIVKASTGGVIIA